uniref:Uncharacterized protein n=1 Tax=viral metagenome TaxID=1070528 RepID=A0A6C0D138_9ZZZZ
MSKVWIQEPIVCHAVAEPIFDKWVGIISAITSARREISVRKIQNTWRVVRFRRLAKKNKEINFRRSLPMYYHAIRENRVTHDKRVSFSEEVVEKDAKDNICVGQVSHEDSETCILRNFTEFVKLWYVMLPDGKFFKHPKTIRAMKYISNEEMTKLIDMLIKSLMSKTFGYIRLWGKQDSNIMLLPNRVDRIVSLREAWASEMKNMEPNKRSKLNPEASAYIPRNTFLDKGTDLDKKLRLLVQYHGS